MQKKFPKSRKLILLFGDIAFMVISAIMTMNLFFGHSLTNVNFGLYINMIPIMIVLMGVLFNIN